MARPKLTPTIAYNLAVRLYKASGERDTRLESVIMQNRDYTYLYSDILLRPWPEAESIIAREPTWAYEYARYILKGSFPEGEPAIAQRQDYARWYANNLLETDEDYARFRKIERQIAQS
jgi:hypothetical protein